MNVKKIIGAIMIAMLFIGEFIMMAFDSSFIVALKVFGFGVGLIVFVCIAVYLMMSDK